MSRTKDYIEFLKAISGRLKDEDNSGLELGWILLFGDNEKYILQRLIKKAVGRCAIHHE